MTCAPRKIDGLPFAEYLAIPAANSSSLKTLLTHSPRTMREQVRAPSAAMSLGTIVHALTLTPDTRQSEIAVRPDNCDKRSNAGKERLRDWMLSIVDMEMAIDPSLPDGKRLSAEITALEEEMGCITVCTQADMEKAEAIRDAILDHPICSVLFAEGMAETTILAEDPESGVRCKARLDWLPEGHDAIVDLKTTQDASWEAFSRSCATYGYHLQAALYRRLYRLLTGHRSAFLHVVVQTAEPYEVAVYELDEEAMAAGEQRLDRALSIWRRCMEAGEWPGTGWDWEAGEYRIESLSLPKWALY